MGLMELGLSRTVAQTMVKYMTKFGSIWTLLQTAVPALPPVSSFLIQLLLDESLSKSI